MGSRQRAQRGFTVFRLAGAPVRLQYSWFVVSAAIVVLFGPQVQGLFPMLGPAAYAVAFAYALILLISVLSHEVAHALTARAMGWPPTEIELNLWGGHTQFNVGVPAPSTSLSIALAGPAANLAIAGVGWFLITVFEPLGVIGMLASMTVLMNFLVGVFNALPGLPLDGGRIVESAVWAATGDQDKGTLAAGWAGRLVVLVVLGAVLAVLAADLQRINVIVVMIAVMVSVVLWLGASDAIRQARARLRHRRMPPPSAQ